MPLKTAALGLLIFGWPLAAQQRDHYTGRWENKDKTVVMEIYASDSIYYGRVASANLKKSNIAENTTILIQMKRKKDVLFGGTFYNIDNQTEYEARIRLINDSLFVMKVFSGIFRQRCKWHKVKN